MRSTSPQTAVAALKRLAELPPDLVIIDLDMPRRGGMQLPTTAASANALVTSLDGINVPGATMAELGRFAILKTLEAADEPTVRAAESSLC